MNKEQLAGIFRTILAALGGVLAAKGVDLGIDYTEMGGALAVIVAGVWSFFSKRKPAA